MQNTFRELKFEGRCSPTLFWRSEAVLPRHVLNLVVESCVGQQDLFFVDSIDGIFEGKLNTAVSLILRENRTCNVKALL